jgi:hypothetical protein
LSRRCCTSEQPEIVFFTDRDLGHQFPAILRESGLRVERHADHCDPDCSDEDWLKVVASQGWVAVTHDARIRYKPNELAAVVGHRVALLVVIGHAPHPELAQSFVATAPQISRFLAEYRPPVIGKVYRPSPKERHQDPNASGRVELWYPKS